MALVPQPLPSNLNIWLSPFKSLCLILTWGRGIIHCHSVDTVMGMSVHDMQHTRASPRQSQTLALIFISFFGISLTSNNRQTKGWLLHSRVWQQTQSVWQQTSSRSGNRQIKGGSVIGLFLRADSTTEGLATVKQTVWQLTKPLSHCG